MGTRKFGMRSLWPVLLVPLGVSLIVLSAATSSYLLPVQTAEEQEPAVAQTAHDDDVGLVRERALLALIKLALSRPPKADPGKHMAASKGTTAPTVSHSDWEAAITMGMLRGNALSEANTDNFTELAEDAQKTIEESKATADHAYDEVERRIAEQAKRAHVAIAVDSTMQVGRDYNATLTIEGGTGEDIDPMMKKTLEPIASELDVEIAPDAEAYASSSQFTIASITPSRQAIRAQAPTVWQWTITPRRDGEAALMIMLRQNVNIGGQIFSFPVKQFPQVIRVDLTWWLWLRDLALSFWGTVTALLVTGASGATIYSAIRRHEDQQPTETSAGRRNARGAI